MTSAATNKPFLCSDCGKEFSKERKLLSHFKVHTSGKSYKCEICAAIFSQKVSYKTHIKTHFAKGSCNCPKCGKPFMKHSWLRKHLNLNCKTAAQNESKFSCRECGKMYDSLACVRNHLYKGKHLIPVFKCFSCLLECSSSKALFVHILQHNDVNIIVVGMDKEKRIEYFSTSKIREKVDAYKDKPQNNRDDKNEITEDARLQPNVVEIKVSDDKEEHDDADIYQEMGFCTPSDPSPNIVENRLQDQGMDQHLLLHSDDSENRKIDNTIPHTDNSTRITNPNYTENLITTTPLESLAAILPTQQDISEENPITNQTEVNENIDKIQSDNVYFPQTEGVFQQKMPKLVNLYPGEDHVAANNAHAFTNSNLVMQSEIPMVNNFLCNGIPVVESMRHGPNDIIMPYAPPMVNTMILPPLFLVQNNMPVRNEVGLQNVFPLGDNTLNNQCLNNKTNSNTIMDELKSMTSEIRLPKKKKKRQNSLRNKYADAFKQLQQEVSAAGKISNPDGNKKTFANSSATFDKTDLPKTTVEVPNLNMHEEENKVITAEQGNPNDLNMYMSDIKNPNENQGTQNIDYSGSKFWDTLIENDDVSYTPINSLQSGCESKSKQFEKVRKFGKFSGFTKSGTKRSFKKCKTRNINTGHVNRLKHFPKDGIGVEDYIKKYMWL